MIDSLIVKYDRVNHRTMYLLNRKGEIGRFTTLSSKVKGLLLIVQMLSGRLPAQLRALRNRKVLSREDRKS